MAGPALSARERPPLQRLKQAAPAALAVLFGALATIFLALAFLGGPRLGGVSLTPIGGGGGTDASGRTLQIERTDEPAEDDGVVRSLEALHSEFGEAPDATMGRMRIPSIGVDAAIGQRGIGEDGAMPNPSGPGDVVWYDFQNWPGLGGWPGGGGNAVFAGHVDRAAWVEYAGVEYFGPGVFYTLAQIAPGAEIVVEAEGQALAYTVVSVDEVAADGDWRAVFSSDLGQDSITLITCGGDFDREQHAYTARTVVRAVRG